MPESQEAEWAGDVEVGNRRTSEVMDQTTHIHVVFPRAGSVLGPQVDV